MTPIILQCIMTGICRWYGVATISRLLKIVRLFRRISSVLLGSFAKETYVFGEPTVYHDRHLQMVWGCRWREVATISRLLKIIGLFCKRAL